MTPPKMPKEMEELMIRKSAEIELDGHLNDNFNSGFQTCYAAMAEQLKELNGKYTCQKAANEMFVKEINQLQSKCARLEGALKEWEGKE